MLPYKQSYFRMTYENKFCYRIIYRIIFESIVFTYYIKSNGSLLVAHFAFYSSFYSLFTDVSNYLKVKFVIDQSKNRYAIKYINKIIK